MNPKAHFLRASHPEKMALFEDLEAFSHFLTHLPIFRNIQRYRKIAKYMTTVTMIPENMTRRVQVLAIWKTLSVIAYQ